MVWVVTPTSLFVLPGLFHWHLRERALDFGTESCSFFSPGSTQGCTVGAFRMCKGPKTCESLRPYKATVTLGPFASDHAPHQQNTSKPTPSYSRAGERMEEGIGARINLWRIWSSFRWKRAVWEPGMVGVENQKGSSHGRSTNTPHPLPDHYPLKTIP